MNTELYFPREGGSFPQTTEKAFESTVKKLSDMDITILFKTEVNLNKESIAQALKETTSGSEKIDVVFIADVLSSTDKEAAKAAAESIGLDGKLTKITAAPGKSKPPIFLRRLP